MSEEKTAGGKQFVFVLLWSAMLYLVCGMIMSLFGSYAFIGGILALIVFCIFGFFVLTHYTARFTYTLKNGSLRINRMIGKRNKEVEFPVSSIVRCVYGVKPSDFAKQSVSMRISVFSGKDSLYIEYMNKENELSGVVIEPSQKLRKRIDRERNKKVNG